MGHPPLLHRHRGRPQPLPRGLQPSLLRCCWWMSPAGDGTASLRRALSAAACGIIGIRCPCCSLPPVLGQGQKPWDFLGEGSVFCSEVTLEWLLITGKTVMTRKSKFSTQSPHSLEKGELRRVNN